MRTRAILAAVFVTVSILALSLAYGFNESRGEICRRAGYETTDSGLAECADRFGMECGNPYVDGLREQC